MLEHRGGLAGQDRAPGAAERFLSKAVAHREAGRLDKARRNIGRVLDMAPDHANARYELGLLVSRTEGASAAIPHFAAALKGAQTNTACWLALIGALLEAQRLPEARAIAERFRAAGLASVSPKAVAVLVDRAVALGRSCYDQQDFVRAEAYLDLAIALDDTHPDATFLAGAVAARTNRLQMAYDLISIAIYRTPDRALYFAGLGSLMMLMEDEGGTRSALEKALELDPNLAIAHSNLAGFLHKRSSYAEAMHHADRAVAIDATCSGAHVNRGLILKSLGRLHDSIAAMDTAIALAPRDIDAHSNRLFTKLYAGDIPATEYAADARAFGKLFADPLLRKRPFTHDRDPNRRLKVGFVSGDLCAHAVARFLEPFLECFDREAFETYAYMTRAAEDGLSLRMKPLFDQWLNISGIPDDAAADRIEADRIDILVDLSGHSAGHRLQVFARKPAPVQVTWMGHPATTGLSAIDYRLTDDVQDGEGCDALHTEALWRLPRVSATYRLADDTPPVRKRPPCAENGFVTFGVMNRFEKVSDAALQTWGRILAAIPDARLFMVVGDVNTPEVRQQVDERLGRAGIDLDRVILQPRVTSGYFELYHQIDIALDPFPYNGGTTSCDTLSMGVPFVTLCGATAPERAGAVVLGSVELDELVATSQDAYVATAVTLATDRERLARTREGLRERFFAGPMTDHARLAGEVGKAFRAMWTRWATGEPCARG
ncbi:tetratricopeptide repeat protein [Methylobacterium sp. J-067]|uniref:tetratricopeptide repeat protein n=1 Tax=Methylobacterium sp. J-067 TaxID=2836648 RepID=UPI001FB9AA16|nr:tetratricopeptide repeat protein [Methylobacterium sp. J-067]MCJ2024792.1 tetratricopeptide repeat protein [Methylobacterium sp. J-067]